MSLPSITPDAEDSHYIDLARESILGGKHTLHFEISDYFNDPGSFVLSVSEKQNQILMNLDRDALLAPGRRMHQCPLQVQGRVIKDCDPDDTPVTEIVNELYEQIKKAPQHSRNRQAWYLAQLLIDFRPEEIGKISLSLPDYDDHVVSESQILRGVWNGFQVLFKRETSNISARQSKYSVEIRSNNLVKDRGGIIFQHYGVSTHFYALAGWHEVPIRETPKLSERIVSLSQLRGIGEQGLFVNVCGKGFFVGTILRPDDRVDGIYLKVPSRDEIGLPATETFLLRAEDLLNGAVRLRTLSDERYESYVTKQLEEGSCTHLFDDIQGRTD